MEDLFQYIATARPEESAELIQNFGYEIQDVQNMGANLEFLVAQEGEKALHALLRLHPHRDVILESYMSEGSGIKGLDVQDIAAEDSREKRSQEDARKQIQEEINRATPSIRKELEQAMNSEATRSHLSMNNQNTILIAALIIGGALILSKK